VVRRYHWNDRRQLSDNEYISRELQKAELHREVFQLCTSCKRDIFDHPIPNHFMKPAHGPDCPFIYVDKYK